ncbi:DOPA 4,5-dioxygenase family protein [Pseudoalteromonas luteoviolacea]|uniref:DOPA 4,5-dioxygenase n=1 Tax=Pseudoalteromonas luteoviolacea DSM 6061 TaxID=1365250 RepID=A0A166WS91_9GAMM|nr:DOPA 4,5-dioxygenase family protein [Pseudoalteromonas luteoviolacea]KZN38015.1 hypothetical protein N475_15420 [Pseudoalteromonas luteoviolacea DSM 6061]KZN54501.1 hypothetical protein N474_01920 [Pseudoalteromonas luteoviolacea CPMOR-2]MBE0388972.1 DOPA 4,5-dioxygenase [Pseudoalteromonas luteoviolacea DSM 6061]TQF70339.1 4,5-dioxygenase [Pseudoalteromonas luteoviolacea]
MLENKTPVNKYTDYHAHVYFDASSRALAKNIYQEILDNFDLKIGTFHEKCVGPHPHWSFQIAFQSKDFEHVIPWLDNKRKNLTVLVHALTGNDYQDHTEFAYWLGEPVKLELSIFS